MQILNLINLEKSDIKYSISRFPDGEVQITLGEFSHKDEVTIECRITSAEELFILMQVADILVRHGMYFDIFIYYLMGARMDRVMDFNRPFTLKMITNILDHLGASTIRIYAPHSNVVHNLFKNTSTIELLPLKQVPFKVDNYQIVLPDEGAVKRYLTYGAKDVVVGEKVRDVETGKILSIKVKNPEVIDGKRPLLIADDLCDGGGTFVGLANAIREVKPDIVIDIVVSHMVNPKGIENLSKNFNHVYFTNSYKDWKNLPENVTQIEVV